MDFCSEAKQSWYVETIHADLCPIKAVLSPIKRGNITPWEINCICGFACGYSPEYIASKIGWAPSSMRTESSTKIYPLLSYLFDEEKISWKKVPELFKRKWYKYPSLKILKKDLLNLEFVSNKINNKNNRRIPNASEIINLVEKLLSENSISNTKSLDRSSTSKLENLIGQGDESSKQEKFSDAIYYYQEALIKRPYYIGLLIKIIRCYDRLKLYKDSFFLCDFALYRLEEIQYKSYLEQIQYKSYDEIQVQRNQIYVFLGGVFHELVLENLQDKSKDKYIDSALSFYQKAKYYLPNDAHSLWNIADLYISVFKSCSVASKEYNYSFERVNSALDNFKSAASRPDSNLKLNREIIADIQRAFKGLDKYRWWQKQLNELKQL